MDSDTLSNDLLGEREVDLDLQDLEGDVEDKDPIPFDVVKEGKTVGTIYLSFAACV